MTLPNRLITARKAKGLTRDELAEKLHVTRACIAHYETGRRDPPLDTLVILSNTLGVSTDYLLKGGDGG